MHCPSVHEFQLGDTVQRIDDGVVGLVVEARALYVSILWHGPFPEVVEVGQFNNGIRVTQRAREAVEAFVQDLLEFWEEDGPPTVADPPKQGRIARRVIGYKVPDEDGFLDAFEDACAAHVQQGIDDILFTAGTK